MFAPSGLSGGLTDRFGARPVATGAGATLLLATTVAAVGATSPALLAVGTSVLGFGWNLALVSGSTLLTAGVTGPDRASREGWGEVATFHRELD